MNLIAPIIFALLAISPAVAQQQQQPRQRQNQNPVIDTPLYTEDNSRNNIDSNNLHIEDA
jgi:hypothetical protein